MSTNFLPRRDGELLTWSVNFNTKITAAPTDYGLTAAQATAYGTKHDAYASAYQTANDPDTRTPPAVIAKDVAKSDLDAEARMLARIVQAMPSVTAEQRSELGLTVRDVEPTPIPAPASAPQTTIVSTVGRTVRVRLRDADNPTRRGKPEGVAGAAIYSFVGATPPAKLSDWKSEGNSPRTLFDVVFDAETAAGATVWIAACWFNPRLENGPASAPVSGNLPRVERR